MKKCNIKNYPKLKFQINIELDKKVCLNFLNQKRAGIDFGASIIKTHTSLKDSRGLSLSEKKNLVNKYIDNYYLKSQLSLTSALQRFKNEWQMIEPEFYSEVDKIFRNHPWPKGLYVCYLSIFDCNPRFLENKTFQVFYKHPSGIKYVASHEMLHFIFYDYLEKRFAKEIAAVSAEKIWTLSEVFNNIVLATSDFVKLTKKQPSPYPEHIKLINKLSLIWAQTNNVGLFLKKHFSSYR